MSERPPQEKASKDVKLLKVYRCKGCNKVLFEARSVKGLSKRCPRCKTVNIYDE